jgi:predicted nucleic acid-binding protein
VRVVVDASALAAMMFREQGSEALVERLMGATLCAPDLLRFELANVAVTKARQHPKSAPEVFAALAAGLEDLGRRVSRHSVREIDVAILARVTGLSAYDATYLWLAGRLEADLVTLDKRLLAALEPDPDAFD